MVVIFIALGLTVLLIRVGFAFYAAGLVRAKNSAGTVMRTISDTSIAILAFWAVGAAFLWGRSVNVVDFNTEFLFGPHGSEAGRKLAEMFFNLTAMLAVTAVVGGAVAERFRFSLVLIVSLVMAGAVIPIAGNWIWRGWFMHKGFIDVGGASAFHLTAGVFGLISVMCVGPRRGKFNRDGSSSAIPGHNLPLAAIGAILMTVGWIALVTGYTYIYTSTESRMSADIADLQVQIPQPNIEKITDKRTVSRMDQERQQEIIRKLGEISDFRPANAAMNVLLTAAAATLTAVGFSRIRYGKPEIVLTLSGLLGGLVAITAGASEVPGWAALVIGAVAGVIVPWAVLIIDLRMRLDDPLGVIAIYLVGGAWSVIAAGIFITKPVAMAASQVNGVTVTEHSRMAQIGVQCVGLVAIGLASAFVAMLLFRGMNAAVGLTAKESVEFEGLDLSEHDISAYPDFQQNTIKSSHLRET